MKTFPFYNQKKVYHAFLPRDTFEAQEKVCPTEQSLFGQWTAQRSWSTCVGKVRVTAA